MELSELIHCKRFDSETHFKLLEFARGNNFVEDLLDFVVALKEKDNINVDDEYVDEINKLKNSVNVLKNEITRKDEELAYFHDQIEASSISLDELVEKTKKEQNRYPSFDEAWSESENRFLKIENKTC
jgi:predicted  nucleic acid-binding Zn-ribbon protein